MERTQQKREALEKIARDGVSRREFARRTMLGSIVAVGGLSLLEADDLSAQALTARNRTCCSSSLVMFCARMRTFSSSATTPR